MKTLYLTDSSANIAVDTETNEVTRLVDEDRYAVRSVYYIEEPMHVVYQSGETREEIDAKKGELLIMFYNNRYNKYILDTVRTKQWVANIKNRRTIEQKEREDWAKKNAEACGECPAPDCNKCECCDKPCCSTGCSANNAEESMVDKIKKTIKKAAKKVKK